ncbi:ferric reductase-like transmembrane domain-containing protein [Clostridium algoriphilum]|uniref:ferric reductase-like transmembrane domain-containing protein n=1 Tax=Clostridium algoriphilum TaxID=198347 RepID=UPI0021F3DE14|nr:ferric reductase-like transmembrane domain-containing protein [Clostridium algoriphilum]
MAYYLVSALIGIIITTYEVLRVTSSAKLYGTVLYLEKVFIGGYVSIAFFILIMFAGAINPKWVITKKLLSIRAELAIIASIFIMPHSIIYLIRFIVLKLPKAFKTGVIPKLYIAYISIGIIAFFIMIPLFITSFKKVRRKIKGIQWARLQRFAYIFYFLVYIHILLVLLNGKYIEWLKLSSYTTIFGIYVVFKLIKYKNNKQAKLDYTKRVDKVKM